MRKEKRKVLGITSSQEELLDELSEDEFYELEKMTFSARRNYLDEVAFLLKRGTREHKKEEKEVKEIVEEGPTKEELKQQLEEAGRQHRQAEAGWRFQYQRAEELAKERRKEAKRKEFERKYGKGTVGLLNPPLRREKVISLDEKEDEEKSVLFFHEPPPKKPRYKTYRGKKARE